MSSTTTPVVNNPNPPRDAAFNHLLVTSKNLARGTPPKDALFTNLTVGEDYSRGATVKDYSFTNLAVTQTVTGSVVGDVVIGHV